MLTSGLPLLTTHLHHPRICLAADSEAFKRHCARLDDYLWVAEDGMKMQGYNGVSGCNAGVTGAAAS